MHIIIIWKVFLEKAKAALGHAPPSGEFRLLEVGSQAKRMKVSLNDP